MKLLCLLLILHLAIAEPEFGKSYLTKPRRCNEWSCINTKLGFIDKLPSKHLFSVILTAIIPKGAWRENVEKIVTTCYDVRPKRYSNMCPGAAILQCIVDQMIENCPEESLKKNDACSPVQTLAGAKYMFTQRVYKNLEDNLSKDRRPSWFLTHYYSEKCCELPPMIQKELDSCGFTSLLHYEYDEPQYDSKLFISNQTTTVPTTLNVPLSTNEGQPLKIVSLKDVQKNPVTSPSQSNLKSDSKQQQGSTDPLDCCDMSEFIRPSWRQECDFKLKWDRAKRLIFENKTHLTTTEVPTTTTPKSIKTNDIMLLPYGCEEENCVFKNLGIVSESGSVDTDAFIKLLDKLTATQPWWTKAKARVVTTCLKKPLIEYDADCEINKILACTFDVLTENCPFKTKDDLCRHTRNNAVCQVSSSKYRPRKRRDLCYLPELVNRNVLTQCNMTTISQSRPAPENFATNKTPKKHLFSFKYTCLDLTPSTSCLLRKMDVLNKYDFMDYFKMKDRIRQYSTNHPEWTALINLLLSSFNNIPMYREQCSSPMKLLNIVDTMLMTCPITRRKNTPQCQKIFGEMTNTVPMKQRNMTKEQVEEIMKHFHNIFMPAETIMPKHHWSRPKYVRKIAKNPMYDYGLLNGKHVPPVQIINVRQTPKKPLVLLPVYMRMPKNKNIILTPHANDGILRGSPFWLHTQIAVAHAKATNSTNPTVSTKTTVDVPTTNLVPIKTQDFIKSSKMPDSTIPTTVRTKTADFTISTTTEDFQKIVLP